MAKTKITLRLATVEDEAYLLGLKNDPVALHFSKQPEPIMPGPHHAWFEKVLFWGNPKIWIAMLGKKRVGSIRVEQWADYDEVSLVVAPEYRGRGIATEMLESISKRDFPLVGWIDPKNAASIRAFEKAGYSIVVKATK